MKAYFTENPKNNTITKIILQWKLPINGANEE
jgi:hypothetical protein